MKYKVHASWTKLNSNGAGSSKLTNYQGRFTTSRHILAIALSAAAIMIIAAVALAADGVLPEQAGSPLRGHYCVTSAGASLDGVFQTETLAVAVNGTPVAAYLYWSGRYAQSTNGDENLTVSLNGGSPVFVAAEQQNSGTSSYSDRYYYTYRSTDLTQPGSPVLINQSTSFTINVGGLRGDEGHGAGIVVVYENAEACSYGDVYLRYGLDSLHHRHGGESGPNSEVNCLEFEAASIERTLDYQMFVGGVANPQRPNAIWTKTGSGPLPENYWLTDIIEDPSAAHLVNPLDGNEGAGEGEWDNHQSQIMVPAGHTYACIQIESVDDYAPETLGASALWVNLAYKVEGTPPATPTNTPTEVPPTATPTSTPTEIPPTATPTSTPTEVPPTATPTNTPTEVPPTATPTNTPTEVPPTATPTSTPTEVPPTATPTSTPTVPVSPTTDGNVTPIATPNIPAPTFTPTPTPTVPLCTAQTDLHLSQAVSTPVDGNITVTISYWNSGPADLANIRIFETIPSGMMLKSDPANSHWSCESGTCTFEAGTLPAGADQNSAQQIQLHLLVDPNLATGQSTTVNRVVISQESQGLSAQNGCFIEGQADIELPTALDEMPEPNQANLVPAVYVPFIYQ